MSEPTENERAIEQVKLYLRCQAAFYDACAKRDGHPADGIRAQMCQIILSDLGQQGRMALSIERLKGFLPGGASGTN